MPPPTAAKPAPLKLFFTTTSLRNVTIATESDEHFYEVVTWDWHAQITRIRRLVPDTVEMEPVAELKKDKAKDNHYSGVKLSSSEGADDGFVSVHAFLEVGNTNSLGTFTTLTGKQYRWQDKKGVIELVSMDEPDGKHLARFHKHHRHLGVLRMSQNPYLEVEPELAPSMDGLIVSFLLAEGRHRA